MRLPDRKFAARAASFALVAALAGCGTLGGSRTVESPPLTKPVNGPAADYPILVGDPYEVNGVTYTPSDVWNSDEVGYVALDSEGGARISGAHHTLPVPSYAEVTSLETGRTILVRIERRGPMDSNALIALSPGAAEQLGATADTPVRVRRVNPSEPERAALRAGERAPERMDTPMSLVSVLKRKLPGGPDSDPAQNGAASASVAQPPRPAAPPEQAAQASAQPAAPAHAEAPAQAAAAPPSEAAPPPPSPAPKETARPATHRAEAAHGGFVVQAGAFAQKANADRVAARIGGKISRSGSLYLVRTGPFSSRAEAEASLAKVKASGYSGARIYKGG